MAREAKYGSPSGAGIIEHRGPNTWRVRFFLGVNPETGKRTYSLSITVHGTKGKAREEAERYRHKLSLAAGDRPANQSADMTVGDYLAIWQTRRRISGEIKLSTATRDRPAIERIERYFGHIPLRELTVPAIKDAYAVARERDGLTSSQLHLVHQKMRQILDEAEADGYIASNPASNRTIKAPRPECNSRRSLSRDQARHLRHIEMPLEAKSRYMGVVIGLATGCRRGEVLGLQWKHIRLDDNPYIEVRQQLVKKHLGYEPPKAGSYRKISIDRDTAEALSKWKAEQAEYLRMTLEDRARRRKHRDELEMGAASRTGRKPRLYSFDLLQTEDTPVVCDSLGEPHNTDNYGAWFRRFCCSVGLGAMCDESGNPVVRRVNEHGFPVDDEGRPYSRSNKNPRPKLHYKGLKFHELRHTNISLLIGNGMDIKIVQQRAGHKKASTTIDIYAHAMPENDRRAADLIGDLLAV